MSRGNREDNLAPPEPDAISHQELDELEALIAGTEAPPEEPEPVAGGFSQTYVEPPPEAPPESISAPGLPATDIPAVSPRIPPAPAPDVGDSRAAGRRLPLKRELIRRIQELAPKCPDVDVGSANRLRATNKAGLQRLLDELEIKAGVKPPPKQPVVHGQPNHHTDAGQEQLQQPPIQILGKDRLMYFGLKTGVTVVENISQQTSAYTGVEMRGAKTQVEADEQVLRPLLGSVYLENKADLDPIMSATVMLATYMAGLGSQTIRPVGEKKGSAAALRTPPPPAPERRFTEVPSGSE